MKRLLLNIAFIWFTCFSFLVIAMEPVVVTWESLNEMNYETGAMPLSLKNLNFKMIKVEGFIVPLDDFEVDYIKEFLLVPDPMSCIHVPPPPPNQMIHVKMKRKIPLDMDYRGVAITGILKFTEPEKDLFSYELAGIFSEVVDIEYEDPFAEFDEYMLDDSFFE